ncbi:phosphotransferase [Magnetovibrio sp. PR-2]|uniref:phosphotransferase n=1 Tax=Magnetovibrio sp. PR-2 TaxID=3120356 RepID=UPI002FCE4C17
MRIPKPVRDNLYFLLAETSSQIANLQVLLETASASVAQRIMDRRGYTYNLKMRIHDGCIETLRANKKGTVNIYSLRAAEALATDLERLTDICHDCVGFMSNLKRKETLKKRPFAKLLNDILQGLDMVETALDEDDTRVALKIGKIERKLDREYDKLFRQHLKDVRKSKVPGDVMTSLIIAQRIEEMGDVLLDVSESIISAKLGKPMHIDRFRSLETALSDLGLIDADVETIAETKSGSGISGISPANSDEPGYVAIFKDGQKDKLIEERDSVESWHDIYPGLAPQILSYKKKGKNAALLIEHLPGLTFEHILLQEDDEHLARALKRLTKTLKAVWGETKKKKAVPALHMRQLKKRLKSVQDIHPDFARPPKSVCGTKVASLEDLLARAETLEQKFAPPFSVYIHGDFNLDNIIFDSDGKKIHFVDLHRSCYMDYVQDVAVFMVSNYRLQVLDKTTRRRIHDVVVDFHAFAHEFAQKNGDKTFELRLALGLARSFITSTRFILDQTLARNMYLRGLYILERLNSVSAKNAKSFKLPIEELFS